MKAKAINLAKEMPVRPARMRIIIPAEKKTLAGKLNGIGLGQKVTFEVTGRVCSTNANSYETELCLDLSALDVESGMAAQVLENRERRRGY